MFEPVMSSKCSYPFGVGHGSNYWKNRNNGKEGFAEMYSATVNKLDMALNKYYERFGENYPLCISESRTTEEIVSDIELCIEIGEKAEAPSYEEDGDY